MLQLQLLLVELAYVLSGCGQLVLHIYLLGDDLLKFNDGRRQLEYGGVLLFEFELEILDDALVMAALLLFFVFDVSNPSVFSLTQQLLLVFEGLNLKLPGFLESG